jgi:hypothetical protein
MIGTNHEVKFAKTSPDSISAYKVDPIHETVAVNFCLIRSYSESAPIWRDLSCPK